MSEITRIVTKAVDFFYIPPFDRIMPRQTFRYALCGGLNMVFGWALFYIFYHFVIAGRYLDFGVMVVSPHTATLYCVFPFTFLLGFGLNRNVAFTRSPLRTRTQLTRYLAAWIASLALNHLLLKLLVEVLHVWSTPAQIIASIIIAFGFSYPVQKYFTFRGCADI